MITFHFTGKEEAFELSKLNGEKQLEEQIIGNEIHIADNLDFLKTNHNRLKNKVKCIYIDPPYNTGKDFVYKDKWKKGKECKHSKWLSFMYPRLKLARDLLTEDGVIFVSIDDNEQANLKLLMNEIFGEENFVGQAQRKTTEHVRVLADYELQKLNDFILIYAKNINSVKFNKKITGEIEYKHKDNAGNYTLKGFQNSGADGTRLARPKLYYPIYVNETSGDMSLEKRDGYIEILPRKVMKQDGRWLWSKEKFEQDKHLLEYKNNTIFRKDYYVEDEDQNKYQAEKLWLDDFQNRLGAKDLSNLGMQGYFDYPKPVALIKHLLKISTKPNDIVLDFFAGSGTTGQAVMELNFEEMQKAGTPSQGEEGNLTQNSTGGRKFILVQLPEKIDPKKEAYKFCIENDLEPVISSITIERIKRAGAKYEQVDTGFKVFKTF